MAIYFNTNERRRVMAYGAGLAPPLNELAKMRPPTRWTYT
jgi:hypothetical protein